jgi:hypothetical protein
MRSAPTLNSWMMPCSSVAMIEKLALVRIAFCSASVLNSALLRRWPVVSGAKGSTPPGAGSIRVVNMAGDPIERE